MKQFMLALLASAAIMTGDAGAQTTDNTREWPTYGHDAGGMRFSPLAQITPANVANLQPAWTYHLKPEGAAGGFQQTEATPLVINGIMYLPSPYGQVVALDATTGKEAWVYKLPSGEPAFRGVEYFPGDKQTPAQIIVPTSEGKMFALDARTGALNMNFGANGIVDLDTPDITHGGGGIRVTTPPIVYKNLVIVGSSLPERNGPGPAGDVRAFDIHTGKLAWTFHSIPQQGEPNYGTWAGNSAFQRTGVNVWGFMTVDAKRGIVYMPFGAPSGDLFGGDRQGNDLYDSSLVAVDARTGKYLWHFQAVHHDIWDFDLETAPTLINVKEGGKTIPAVAVFGKSSFLFLLNRTSGKPIYDVTEKPVAQSDVPGETLSPTQPFPAKPGPLARVGFNMADIATVTPELEANCRKIIADNNVLTDTGPFAPPTYNRVRVIFPSEIGGADWGGASFNPALGYLFINVNDLGQFNGLKDPESGTIDPAKIAGTNNRGGRTGPYVDMAPSGRFRDPATRMFCNQPPWGELEAVNVNTGDIAWRVPLGVTDSLPADKQNTGRPGEGGSIATASGLVFIGASDDSRFRAFDARTGKELWTVKLDASAESVPSTYLGKDGRQYVAVVAAGGGDAAAPVTSDELTVFALPK
ncbi:MAG TPA: pyrroloquinoline quinone-dependent dehydrogenase [Rhizomicrobium sp.]|nr:pyrroloquinoline quinone-dependent dehydrogenase [Rhizomicrobium sp.]